MLSLCGRSPIGILIVAIAFDNRPRCPLCHGRLDGKPKVCPHCRNAIPQATIEAEQQEKEQREKEQREAESDRAAAAAWAKRGSPAIPDLVGRLRDKHDNARWKAAWAIALMGPGARNAVPDLVESLRGDKQDKVRYFAAWALGEIGAGAKTAIPDLIESLLDKHNFVQRYAACALVEILGPEARNAIPADLHNQAEERKKAVVTDLRKKYC